MSTLSRSHNPRSHRAPRSLLPASRQTGDFADAALRADLRRRLLSLNFHAFARCLALLLEKMGYTEVTLTGRRDWKGKNQAGGYDLVATLPAPLSTPHAPRRMVVQVKQYDALPLYQRSVDELRGACLRAGAAEALLITTSTFSPSVGEAAVSHAAVAPVRLLDGEELLDRLVAHRVGVWVEAGERAGVPSRFGVDTAFFEDLDHAHSGNSRADCPGRVPPSHWRVTVSVQAMPPEQRVGRFVAVANLNLRQQGRRRIERSRAGANRPTSPLVTALP
jgi:hypothetical protein